MKKFLLGLSVLTVTVATAQTQANPKSAPVTKAKTTAKTKATIKPAAPILKNENDSFSYALGLNVGNNLKEQGITGINYAVMQKALDDVYKSTPVLLDQTQANKTIQQRLQGLATKKAAKMKEAGVL